MKRIAKKRFFTGLVASAVLVFFVVSIPVFAQDTSMGLDQFGAVTQLSQRPLIDLVSRIVNIFLGVLGVIGVIIIIIGGYIWMTSAGNEEKIEQAKALLRNGVIGLVIILMSFAIARFIISRFQAEGFIPSGGGGGVSTIGALGPGAPGGLLEAVSPEPGEEVCRNISLMIQFKVPMDKATLSTGSGTSALINSAGIALKRHDGSQPAISTWRASLNDDGSIAVYGPAASADYLGDPNTSVLYDVTITNAVRSAQGESVFAFDYTYSFTVLPCLDTTPPQVATFYPDPRDTRYQQSGRYVRNTAVLLSFSKPVNPLTIAGTTAKISLIVGSVPVAGVFGPPYDNFRSVRFTPTEKCGTNACGNDIYCLPANADITVTAKAASLASPPNPTNPNEAGVDMDGVMDRYKNSLDGGGALGVNKNNKAEGPPADNFILGFKTSDVIDLASPQVTALTPDRSRESIPGDGLIMGTFSKPVSKVNSTLFSLNPPAMRGYRVGYNRSSGSTDLQSLVISPYESLAPKTQYIPTLTSGIEDVNFNCYLPCAGPACVAIGTPNGSSIYDPPYQKGQPWNESATLHYQSCAP